MARVLGRDGLEKGVCRRLRRIDMLDMIPNEKNDGAGRGIPI